MTSTILSSTSENPERIKTLSLNRFSLSQQGLTLR